MLLLGLALLAAGVAGSIFVIKKLQASSRPAAVARAEPTVTVTVEGAEAVEPSQPIIEFEDDKISRNRTGSAATRKPRAGEREDRRIDRANEAADAPAVPANRPGKIVIMLQHASAIEIDGKVVSQSSQGGSFEITPGEHTIKITAPDRVPVSRTVTVIPGGSTVIRIVDDTEGAAPPAAPAPADPAPAAPAPAPAPSAPAPAAPAPSERPLQ